MVVGVLGTWSNEEGLVHPVGGCWPSPILRPHVSAYQLWLHAWLPGTEELQKRIAELEAVMGLVLATFQRGGTRTSR